MRDNIQIKRLEKNDVVLFRQLTGLFRDVFEMSEELNAEESYLANLLEKPDFIAMTVFSGNEIAGGLTAYILPMYYSPGFEIYIYDIAIKPAFQRKGLGRQLLNHLKQYCRQNGISLLFVEAHAEDEHALDFYHATGGKAEKVIHFNYFLGNKGENK